MYRKKKFPRTHTQCSSSVHIITVDYTVIFNDFLSNRIQYPLFPGSILYLNYFHFVTLINRQATAVLVVDFHTDIDLLFRCDTDVLGKIQNGVCVRVGVEVCVLV